MSQPVFRFAPSPNGALHLGHAYSALANLKSARETGGIMLLRIEDIDTTRCSVELENQMLRDLEWIGFEWDSEPVRQSERFDLYHDALSKLIEQGLLYPSELSRSQLKTHVDEYEAVYKKAWPRDPDGGLLFPVEKRKPKVFGLKNKASGNFTNDQSAMRINVDAALERVRENCQADQLKWIECAEGFSLPGEPILAQPEQWGDFLVSRKDTPTSYHLSCVVDDHEQGVSHLVRGKDLFFSTSAQRLLQELLGFEKPLYHHHKLILDEAGKKLSKSDRDTSLNELRQRGVTAENVREMLGL